MDKVCMLIAMETLEVRSFVQRSHFCVSCEAKFTLWANYTVTSTSALKAACSRLCLTLEVGCFTSDAMLV